MKNFSNKRKKKTEIEMLEIKVNKQMSKQGYDQNKNFHNYSSIELA